MSSAGAGERGHGEAGCCARHAVQDEAPQSPAAGMWMSLPLVCSVVNKQRSLLCKRISKGVYFWNKVLRPGI